MKIDIQSTTTYARNEEHEYPDIWCEIPPNGRICAHAGLKHAKLYSLLAKGGLARQHVRVANLRDPGAKQGKTLFHLGDLLRFLDELAAQQGSGQLRKHGIDTASDPSC
jgi:predicted phosphoadenosine phosphosulfate sulfurtransferase